VPELPEVETVRRGLQPVMEGARIVKLEARRPDLRRPLPADFARRVEGQTVTGIGRRAKYLTVDLSSGDVLLVHLGMSGSFRVSHEEKNAPGAFHHPRSAAPAHDHVVFHMSSGATVTFNDPRRFGLMLLVPRTELASHPLMREVGPEPLGNAFDAGLLAAACAGK
jgi:formamidopyrimidine-DNA glycosylase